MSKERHMLLLSMVVLAVRALDVPTSDGGASELFFQNLGMFFFIFILPVPARFAGSGPLAVYCEARLF
jgi:hypothetical protein